MDSPELDKEVEYAKYYGIISIAISSAGMTQDSKPVKAQKNKINAMITPEKP